MNLQLYKIIISNLRFYQFMSYLNWIAAIYALLIFWSFWIYRRLLRYKQLGGLVPVPWLGVPPRCKASKLKYPLRILPEIKKRTLVWQYLSGTPRQRTRPHCYILGICFRCDCNWGCSHRNKVRFRLGCSDVARAPEWLCFVLLLLCLTN